MACKLGGPADWGAVVPVHHRMSRAFFDTVIEDDRDHENFVFLSIVEVFPDSLGAKSGFVESKW
jgi:hypothetical protein